MDMEEMELEEQIEFIAAQIANGIISNKIMNATNVNDVLKACDEMELWLIKFYYEFGNLRE